MYKKYYFVKPLDLLSLTVSECFRYFKMDFSIYMCIIFCQSLFFSHFILHSQDLSSWNPLKKQFLVKGNQTKPTYGKVINAHPLCIHLPSLLWYRSFYCPPSFPLFLSLCLVTLHPWECETATEPDVEYDCPRPHICVEINAHSLSLCFWAEVHDRYKTRHTLHFHTFSHAATRGCLGNIAYACKFVCSYMCRRCSRVYRRPPCHSGTWAWWFVEGSGAFVLSDSSKHNGYIYLEQPEIQIVRAWEGDGRNTSRNVWQRRCRKQKRRDFKVSVYIFTGTWNIVGWKRDCS